MGNHLRGRAITRKLPLHRGVFSYSRIPTDGGGVMFRLFRRDMRRVLHAESLPFHPDCTRKLIADTLRKARRRLRDQVDEVDLKLMGVS